MELSVIIVNYNVCFFLEQCLFSVRKACSSLKAEVIVVDNNSSDGSRNILQEEFKDVTFVWKNTNDGFGKACNEGMELAKGEVIVFLNPDTIVSEDCFLKCISFIQTKSDCGALGVKMLDGSGVFLPESKRGFPTPSAAFFRLTGLTYLFPQSPFFSAYYAGHLSEHQVQEIDVIAGAFFMVRKKVLTVVGGFDEDFFMYGEDVDLSYRIQKAGFKNYYYPQTTIIHFKGESTLKSKAYLRHFYDAMYLFIKKHYRGLIQILMMRFAILLGKWIATVQLVVKPQKLKQALPPAEAAVVCAQEEFSNLIHIIKHAVPSILIRGRIAVNFYDQQNVIGIVDDLPVLFDKGIKHFVLSEGVLSFKEIISVMDKFSRKCCFMVHADGSHSIVGSDDKSTRGYVIAAR